MSGVSATNDMVEGENPTNEAKTTSTKTAKEYVALIDELDLKSLICPVTGNQAVAICTNPHSPQRLLCASCLIHNGDIVKKYRSEMLPIEDIKQRILEGLSHVIGGNMVDEIENDLQTFKSNLKQQILMAVSEKFDEAFDKKLEEFKQKASNIQAEVPEGLDVHLLKTIDVS